MYDGARQDYRCFSGKARIALLATTIGPNRSIENPGGDTWLAIATRHSGLVAIAMRLAVDIHLPLSSQPLVLPPW
jgi:hypothetical protein